MDIRDTMYTVGMIFRVIWPSSSDIPKTILEVVLRPPLYHREQTRLSRIRSVCRLNLSLNQPGTICL